ncbi:MAG: hypothetical protein J7L89_05940 [Bacteroidales bacterium]|nr:hypothetical protein [Bacteroidales bacterium]
MKVGPEGNFIDLDSIQINIPGGALNKEIKLKVYAKSQQDVMSEYALTSTYFIENLPETVNQPLEIRLKFQADIEGDTLVAVGEKGIAKSMNNAEVFAFQSEPAVVDNGYLVYELSNGGGEPLKSGGNPLFDIINNQIQILGLNRYMVQTSNNGHFQLAGPKTMASKSTKLAGFFETAYDTCAHMGFTLNARSWPVKVFFKPFNDPTWCGYYASYLPGSITDESLKQLFNKGRFAINTELANDEAELRVTAGHEFLHLVQNLYEFSDPDVMKSQIWLEEACAVWIESKYSNRNNYVSSSINGNEKAPFNQWQTASDKHGYGMSVVIKDIAGHYGNQAIVKIHEAVRDGTLPMNATDPLDAIFSVINEPVAVFHHAVLGDYLLGKYYQKEVIKRVWQNQGFMSVWNINSDQDTVFTQTWSAPDMSGKLFYCSLKNPNPDPGASMTITVDDPVNCGIWAGKYKSTTGMIRLGEIFPDNGGTLTLPQIKDVQDDQSDIIVMITNSKHNTHYDGSHDITVTMSLKADSVPGSPPRLLMPEDFTLGYFQYLYYTTTLDGPHDTLFFYKLDDPGAKAQAYEQWPDGSWLQTFILGGSLFDSLFFNGQSLAVFQHVQPGDDLPLIVRVENDYGTDIDTTVIHIGGALEGIRVIDSAALWYQLYSSTWTCYPPSDIHLTFGTKSLSGSYSDAEYYDINSWGDTLAKNSVQTSFSLSINDASSSGSGHVSYTRKEYTNNGVAKEPYRDTHLDVNMTFGSTYTAGLGYNKKGPSSFSITLVNSSASTNETRTWHFWNKPDSTNQKTFSDTGPVSFEFYGYLSNK